MLLAGSETTSTTTLALATVVVTTYTTLGCTFIVGSLSSSSEVLAQLDHFGKLFVVTTDMCREEGNPGDG